MPTEKPIKKPNRKSMVFHRDLIEEKEAGFIAGFMD